MELSKSKFWKQGWRLISNREKAYGVLGFIVYLIFAGYILWKC